MPEDQITFRTDPRFKARIAELVREGAYKNLSDFLNQAILLKFQLDRVHVDGQSIGPDPMEAFIDSFFDSPRGRAVLREVILEAREH